MSTYCLLYEGMQWNGYECSSRVVSAHATLCMPTDSIVRLYLSDWAPSAANRSDTIGSTALMCIFGIVSLMRLTRRDC